MYSQEQKLKVADKAINHVLKLIRQDKIVQGKMGEFTETYSIVTAAAAALGDRPQEEIMEKTIAGSSDTPHSTVEDYL